jgi:hypothetical protein
VPTSLSNFRWLRVDLRLCCENELFELRLSTCLVFLVSYTFSSFFLFWVFVGGEIVQIFFLFGGVLGRFFPNFFMFVFFFLFSGVGKIVCSPDQ